MIIPKRLLGRLITALATLLFSLNLYAFDTRTHVWVSQQVINDLEEDGDLDIPPFNNLPISSDRLNAILNNKSSYRLGNIGPDGFPDLISGQQTTHPGVLGGWATDGWLHHLMSNYSGYSEEMKAFSLGYLGHAAADTFAHTYVNWYAGDAFSLGNGIEEELRHTVVEKLIAEHQPSLTNFNGEYLGAPHQLISKGDSIPKSDLVNALILDKDVVAEYSKVPMTVHISAMATLYHSLGDVEDDLSTLNGIDWTGIYGQIESAVMKLYVYQNTVLTHRVFKEVTKEVCREEWTKLGSWLNPFWGWKTVCDTVTEIVDITEEVVQDINDEIADLIDKKEDLQSIEFWVKEALRNWKSGIYTALQQYEVMSSNMAAGLMAKEPVTHYLTDWLSCYFPVFIGIPKQITNSKCYVSDSLNSLVDKLAEAEDLAYILFPHELGPIKLYQNIRNKISHEIQRQLVELAKKEIGSDMVALIETIKGDVSDQGVNEVFTKFSGGSKGLLSIADAASRIKTDMALTNGKFNPEKFNVAWNAVQLAKLSLLDSNGYRELLLRGGKPNANYNQSSPLIGFLYSIDGNHQWFETAPAYPREKDYLDLGELAHREYGYPADNGGLLIWNDETLRENVFKKVFKGPIAPSLEAPQELGHTRLIPHEHTYRTCHAFPFPDKNVDQQCDIIPLIPVILSILN